MGGCHWRKLQRLHIIKLSRSIKIGRPANSILVEQWEVVDLLAFLDYGGAIPSLRRRLLRTMSSFFFFLLWCFLAFAVWPINCRHLIISFRITSSVWRSVISMKKILSDVAAAQSRPIHLIRTLLHSLSNLFNIRIYFHWAFAAASFLLAVGSLYLLGVWGSSAGWLLLHIRTWPSTPLFIPLILQSWRIRFIIHTHFLSIFHYHFERIYVIVVD